MLPFSRGALPGGRRTGLEGHNTRASEQKKSGSESEFHCESKDFFKCGAALYGGMAGRMGETALRIREGKGDSSRIRAGIPGFLKVDQLLTARSLVTAKTPETPLARIPATFLSDSEATVPVSRTSPFRTMM